MLDSIKKKLGITQAVPVLESIVDTSAVQTEFSQMRTEMDAGIATLSSDLATAVDQLEKMTAAFNVAQSALNALTAEKAELAVTAAAAKFTARKEKVVLAIGTEKADGLMLATQGLDDVAFEAVVTALAGSVDVEASTELFTEVGVAASADTTKIVAESAEMRIIKNKYSNGVK